MSLRAWREALVAQISAAVLQVLMLVEITDPDQYKLNFKIVCYFNNLLSIRS